MKASFCGPFFKYYLGEIHVTIYSYQFLGFATPSTNPGTPDEKAFYIAVTPGTYSGFGSYVLGGNKLVFFIYSSSWSPTAVELSNGAVPVEELLPAAGLLPNVFYDIGVRSSALNVVLQAEADASIYNEYMLRFTLGSAVPLISFPLDIIWPVDDDGNVLQPVYTPNTTYKISIVRKHATYVKWKYTEPQV